MWPAVRFPDGPTVPWSSWPSRKWVRAICMLSRVGNKALPSNLVHATPPPGSGSEPHSGRNHGESREWVAQAEPCPRDHREPRGRTCFSALGEEGRASPILGQQTEVEPLRHAGPWCRWLANAVVLERSPPWLHIIKCKQDFEKSICPTVS